MWARPSVCRSGHFQVEGAGNHAEEVGVLHEAADGLAAGAEGRKRRKVGRVVHAGPADGDVVGEDLAEGDERGVAHAVAFAVLVAQRVLQELELVVLERDVGGLLHAVADLQQRAVGAEAGERPDVGVAETRDAVEALLRRRWGRRSR